MNAVRVGLVGSQFIASIHLEALRSVPGAEVVAVTSATEAHARDFAERHGIPRWFTDYRTMYELPDLDLVVLGLPNDLHCEATVAAAGAGKHVVCEKPLCLNLAEADRALQRNPRQWRFGEDRYLPVFTSLPFSGIALQSRPTA